MGQNRFDGEPSNSDLVAYALDAALASLGDPTTQIGPGAEWVRPDNRRDLPEATADRGRNQFRESDMPGRAVRAALNGTGSGSRVRILRNSIGI